MFRYRVFIIRRLGCTKWWLRDAGPLGPDAPGAGGVDVMLISQGTVCWGVNMAGKAHQIYIHWPGWNEACPRSFYLLAALAATAASSAAAFAPSTLLASQSTGDKTRLACLLVFYRGAREKLDTAFLRGGGAALPWLMVWVVQLKATQRALLKT